MSDSSPARPRQAVTTSIVRGTRTAHLGILRLEGQLRNPPRRAVLGGRFSILADVPTYADSTPAGSERSLHSVLAWLAERGHTVNVAVPTAARKDELDGVTIRSWSTRKDLRARYKEADIVVTQLGRRNSAIRMAARARRPLIHFLRMGGADPNTVFGRPELVVFNAHWIQERFPWPGPSMVLPSPVFADDYRVTSDHSNITLVGLSELKGARTFFALAQKRPDLTFLGVKGAWGEQLIPSTVPDNVEIATTTDDIREIYARTRILLMPSSSEALPRAAREAAASGIPTIAHPAAGLREVLGSDGLYAHRERPDEWLSHLDRLDDRSEYDAAAKAAHQVSARWDPLPDLVSFEAVLHDRLG